MIALLLLKLAVWCGVKADGIVAPYLFRYKKGSYRYSEWCAITTHAQYNLVSKNAVVEHRHLIVPTGWGCVQHRHQNHQFIQRTVW